MQFGDDLLEISGTELAVLKVCCEKSHLDYTKVFFREREGSRFRVSRHHKEMCQLVDDIISGKYTRVIINVPPGYTKTEIFVIEFISRGLALNPKARFIHTSYSDKLVLDNSVKIRDTITLPLYQAMWPRSFRIDTRAKGLWRTREGGGLLASPAGGAVIGFRAGTMDEGFTGALIIDDPLKPDDARSETLRQFINARHNNTFRSRLAHERVPIIVVMQRIHPDDYSGMLLSGGSQEAWDHLMLPVEIDNDEPYPREFTHGRPLDVYLDDGPLWEEKHDEVQIDSLKMLGDVYHSQYAQRPIVAGGNIFKLEWFGRYEFYKPPEIKYRCIYGDTAQKTDDRNDFSVFECWGETAAGRSILLDLVRGKWEAPELERMAREFWKKHSTEFRRGYAPLRAFKIEDKVSGTGLIQSLRRGDSPIPVVAIKRHRDKYMRALDIVPHCAAGNVLLPREAPWLPTFEKELSSFDGEGTGFDDQIDPMLDAVAEISGKFGEFMETTVRGHS